MDEHAVAGPGAGLDLRRGPGSRGPEPRPFHWMAPRGLRLAVAAADFVQVAWIGVATHSAASAAEAPSWKALALGLLVAESAAATRGALRGGGGDAGALGRESGAAEGANAALATAGSVAAAGLMCWLLAPHLVARMLVEWFIAWAFFSALLSAGLRLGAARLKPSVCRPVRAVVVGQADRAQVVTAPPVRLAAPPRAAGDAWWTVRQVDASEAGWLDRLAALVAGGGVDLVALALDGPDASKLIAAVCERLSDQPVRLCLAVDATALSRAPRSLERCCGVAFVDLLADPHGGLDGAAKRAMDVALSAAALLLLSPLLAAAALAVRLESPGPALFRQQRFGLGGRTIEVLKFRTMRAEAGDASGGQRTRARDPRVTRVGRLLRRTSIDELPQLANVLRGDMSLVGPRPHPLKMRVGELYYFDAVERYRTRHLVRPGITGWAQVNGSRGEVDSLEKARRRVELDLWYLENWSVWVDCWIIARTLCGGFLTVNAD